jgi:hypothetical protein
LGFGKARAPIVVTEHEEHAVEHELPDAATEVVAERRERFVDLRRYDRLHVTRDMNA